MDYAKKLKKVFYKAKLVHEKNELKNDTIARECENLSTVRLVKITVPSQLKNLNLIMKSLLTITNIFNKHFNNIGEELASKIDETNESYQFNHMVSKSIFLRPKNHIEVFNVTKNLNDTCRGLDKLNAKTIKTLNEYLCHPLARIFNVCLENGIFPEHFMKAIIIPIHKNVSKKSVNNYRPIFLFSDLAKILEKIIFDRIVKFLETNKLLSKQHFGSRKVKARKMLWHVSLKSSTPS